MSRICLKLWIAMFGLALAPLWGGDASAQSDALFVPLPENRLADPTPQQAQFLGALQATPTTASLQLVRINLDAMQGEALTIALPDAGEARVTRRKLDVLNASNFSWFGDLQAPGGPAILIVKNGEVAGTIQTAATIYTVTPLGGGVHALVSVDQTKIPKEKSALPAEKAAVAPEGAAGMTIHIDPRTGARLPEPAAGSVPLPLSPQLRDALSTSHQGLVEVPSPVPGGGVKLDLQGRFQSPLVVTIDADGKTRTRHIGPQSETSDKK